MEISLNMNEYLYPEVASLLIQPGKHSHHALVSQDLERGSRLLDTGIEDQNSTACGGWCGSVDRILKPQETVSGHQRYRHT